MLTDIFFGSRCFSVWINIDFGNRLDLLDLLEQRVSETGGLSVCENSLLTFQRRTEAFGLPPTLQQPRLTHSLCLYLDEEATKLNAKQQNEHFLTKKLKFNLPKAARRHRNNNFCKKLLLFSTKSR